MAQQGDLKKAKKSLERAIEIDPSNPIAWAELAEIKKKLGEDK
jgi:Tfp pilus assembly protein PilF